MTDNKTPQKTIDEGIIKKGGINQQPSSTERPPNPIGQGGSSSSQSKDNIKQE